MRVCRTDKVYRGSYSTLINEVAYIVVKKTKKTALSGLHL